MRLDRPVTRKELLLMGAAVVAGGGALCFAGKAYLTLTQKKNNAGTDLDPTPTSIGVSNGLATLIAVATNAQLETQLASGTQRAITDALAAVANIPSETPTSIPTLAATLSPTPSMVPIPSAIPTLTLLEACRGGLNQEQFRLKELGKREINSWPAAISLPSLAETGILGVEAIKDWYLCLELEKADVFIGPSVVYTHDWLKEVFSLSSDSEPFRDDSLDESVNSTSRNIYNGAHVWVTSREDSGGSRNFPQAKDLEGVLFDERDGEIAKLLSQLQSSQSVAEVRAAFESQLMTIKKSTVGCRTTWLYAPSLGGGREDQNPGDICTLYTYGVQRGREYYDNFNATLFCSHEAPIILTWLHSMEIIPNFEGTTARLNILGQDGLNHFIYVRAFDPWSQPKQTGFPPPLDINGNEISASFGPGCGTEIHPFCEVGGGGGGQEAPSRTPKRPSASQQPGVSDTPRPGDSPTPQPPDTPTPRPPDTQTPPPGETPTPHEENSPTPAPTNEDIIPTATPGEPPQPRKTATDVP